MVADLTTTNAHLTAENARLNDRMAKLVKDLTEENKQLLGENQRLNQTVQKVCHDVFGLTVDVNGKIHWMLLFHDCCRCVSRLLFKKLQLEFLMFSGCSNPSEV